MTDFDADGSTGLDRNVDVTSTREADLTGADARLSDRGEEVIPVAEERLRVGKRDVSHGRVRIRSYVVETPVEEQVTLREERVAVERRPADRALSDTEQAFQKRTIEAEKRGRGGGGLEGGPRHGRGRRPETGRSTHRNCIRHRPADRSRG
jgi:Domain of unknown function (DUF2382)